MCMFCAAIPATLALGAKAHTDQRRQQQEQAKNGEPVERPKISAGAATAVVVAGLAVGSIVYHSQLGG